MVSVLSECCCEVLDPCFSIEPVVLHDGWTDEGNFYFYVYNRSTYFDVVYYTTLCNVDTSLLNFRVNKAVGVTSDTVSLIAYDKLLNCQHFVTDYYLYYEGWFYRSVSVDVCSQVVSEAYTCKNIKDFNRSSYQGGFYFEYFIYQVKKYVPYNYILPAPITPVGCEDYY